MGKYKKCPRCELNWIQTDEDLCEVCKAELGKASSISLLEEDDDFDFDDRICPICKVSYLEPEEDICPACRAEQAEKELNKGEDDGWKEFVDDEEPISPDDDDNPEVSLSEMQENEDKEFFDDEEPEFFDDEDKEFFEEEQEVFDDDDLDDEDDEDDDEDDDPDDPDDDDESI